LPPACVLFDGLELLNIAM